MIELTEKTYVVGYWFASMKNNDCWYLIAIKENDKYRWQYTFRYNKDDDPHSGKDEKHIRAFEIDAISETEEDFIFKIDKIFEVIKLKYNHFIDRFLVQAADNKFIEIARTKDYFHMKQAISEEEKDLLKKEEN
jgi:hypothetical protein